MGAPVNVKARPGEAGARDGFQLSPGITPFLTDLFVGLVPLALGLELGLFRGRGRWSPALAGGLLSMALVKIATDPTDLPDLVVALWGAATALVYGYAGRRAGGWDASAPARGFLLVMAVGAVGLGLLKATTDVWDPFDLMLGILEVVGGLTLGGLIGLRARRSSLGGPGGPTPRGASGLR